LALTASVMGVVTACALTAWRPEFLAEGAHPQSTLYDQRLRAAVRDLPVAVENRSGYDRDKFHLWVDADGDGCDTREEVLIAEARLGPQVDSECDIGAGLWFSYYDRRFWRDPSDLDIDHLVPLAEAWDSGARKWNTKTRERYANDLGDPRPLVAVTDNVNQSKGDQDPADWMPEFNQCTYVNQWVADKIRWHLTVDQAEKDFLRGRAAECPNNVIKIERARVVLQGSGGGICSGPGGKVRITRIVYDPSGPDDGSNLNAERVVLINLGAKAASLCQWTLRDEAGATFTFPGLTLRTGKDVVVHSGSGSRSAHDLYAAWGSTWNNTGDTATLHNRHSGVVDSCSWSSDGSGSTTC
jgi:hypothetical protein